MSFRGKRHTVEVKMKISISCTGPRNSQWRGGISFLPYCPKFNKKFREKVRKFFDYTCVECGEKQTDKKLAVHHVHYDKQVLCNGNICEFVPLCEKCHGKTNHNRKYWEKHFSNMIRKKYNGKCY